MIQPTELQRSAVLSKDQTYRYRLSRHWEPRTKPQVTFLMLNPSTADGTEDDATIRKCMGFADRWGFGGMEVLNLFAFRSRDPHALLEVRDPIGPEYSQHLYDGLFQSTLLVAAWGCESTLRKLPVVVNRPRQVLTAVKSLFPALPVECLGVGKSGNPYHPLMLGYNTPRIPFPVTP